MHATEDAVRPSGHGVVVYDDPMELTRTIGEFSVAALALGGAVVLLARRDHLEAADEWVRLSPSLLSAEEPLLTDGRYRTLDADDVIRELDVLPDPSRAFERLLDSACKQIPVGTEVIHIFGDLVGALWESGKADLALEIELTGARLAAQRGVSVLCAYPARAVTSSRDAESILGCHTHLVPRSTVPRCHHMRRERSESATLLSPGSVQTTPVVDLRALAGDGVKRSMVFPASIPACRAARRFVRATAEDAGSDADVIDAAELVCSELAANAVRHAQSVFTVEVICSAHRVRVAVADEARPDHGHGGDEASPFPVRAARGLGIVSELSRDWGVEEELPGKTVWAELGRAPRAP